jgi:hypothetical protein
MTPNRLRRALLSERSSFDVELGRWSDAACARSI